MKLIHIRLIRDLKIRKTQVLILVLILSLGGAAWFGLLMSTGWRADSLNEYYDNYNLDDGVIIIRNENGIDLDLIQSKMALFPELDKIDSINYRFRYGLSYEFNGTRGFTVVKGYIYGYVSFNHISVDGLWLKDGEFLNDNKTSQPRIMLDENFMENHGLALNDSIGLRLRTGIRSAQVVAAVRSPEWILAMDPESTSVTPFSSFGIGYTLLSNLQDWLNLSNNVNQIMFKSVDSTNIDNLGSLICNYLASNEIDSEFKPREEFPSYRWIKRDLKGDENSFQTFAIIIFVIAIFSLWISINRLITHQRREIGIDLSLGNKHMTILQHYLSYGALIGILGGMFAIFFGYWLGIALSEFTWDFMNIPVSEAKIPWVRAMQSFLLCLVCSLFSAFWPAWKSSRMVPIHALRQDPALAISSNSISKILTTLLTPIAAISINARIGVRNVLRNRRRTLATILGFGLSVSLIIFVLGAMTTFTTTIDDYQDDQGEWDIRVTMHRPVSINDLDPIVSDSRVMNSYYGLTYFAQINTGLETSLIQIMSCSDFNNIPMRLDREMINNGNSIALSKSLIDELELSIKDEVSLYHLVFGESGYSVSSSQVQITASHQRVSKLDAFLPWETMQSMLNVENAANILYLNVDTKDINDVRTELYNFPFIQLVEVHEDVTRDIKDTLEQFMGVFNAFYFICFIIAFAVILLTSIITHAERERETGTLATLGASDGTILKISLWEVSLIAIAGVIFGYVLGWVILDTILIPMMVDKYDSMVFESQIIYSQWIMVGIASWILALISQLPILRSLRKMDLSQATKVRDF